ncbi:MAG TPA: hypothetical protein VL326_37090 [Kofleriaceae bacterium]|jgi:hypothetical protein|nr:hypothetical protein [Kofleriaceae bacterium]
MRALALVMVVVAWLTPAFAGSGTAKPAAPAASDKAFKPYAGRLVISPDTPPATLDELPDFLKGNLSKDNAYDLVKGPPWPFHMVGVLAKDAKKVTLVVADKDDKNLTPLLSIELTPMRKIVIAHTEATVAAGFAAHKTYVVRVMNGKTLLAKSELTLHD